MNSRDGKGVEARLAYPTGAAMDHLGNVYFVESSGSIRRVKPDGTVETVAWAYQPRSIASDPAGRIYVTGRGPILRIDTDGSSEYLIGPSDVDGIAVAADGTIYFSSTQNMIIVAIPPSGPNRILSPPGPESWPGNMIVLKNGDLLVCDVLTQTILRFTPDGVASYVPLQYPDPSDPYLGHLRNPTALLEAANGDILIANSDNNAIRRFSSDFVLKTLAGAENPVGATDGPLSQAKFRSPQHAIEGPSGVIYVADTYACTIRAISEGVVSTFAGAAGECAEVDGPRQQSRFFHPSFLALDPNGNLIVASWRGSVRRITADGEVTTFPLSPLLPITGLAVNSTGEIFVAASSRVFKIALDGTRSIFSPGSFGRIQGMSFDGEGNLIVAGATGLVRIDPAGVGTTFHGSLWWGLGVVTEPGGYLLVSDYSRNALVRFDRNARASLLNGRISSTGIVSPFGSLEGLSRLSDGRILATDFYGGAVRIAVPALPDRATIDQPMGPKEEARTLRAQPLTGSHHYWELLKRPRGSRAQPISSVPGAATFTPDVEGFYTFRLTSTVGNGAASVSEVSFRTSAGFGSSFYTVAPCRVADSRDYDVVGPARPDWSTFVLLPGSCGIPPSARAVALNVTAPQPSTQGSLSVYPDIGSASPASTVSFGLPGPRAAQTIVGLSPEGQIRIDVDRGQVPGSFVHFIIDVAGYFDDSLPARPARTVE